jgi:propanol-preferring alcohol dehydrogenase
VSTNFPEYVTISPNSLLSIPPTTLPATRIAPLLCAGGTALAGLRATCVISPGEWVCVTGAAGGVGALACRYALHMGLKVVAIDSVQKATVCEALGVHAFVDYENSDTVVSRVREVTGGNGPHGVVVCSANPTSYSQAVEYAAVGGRIVSIGPSMVHLHTGHMMAKGLRLIAQCNGRTKDIQDAIKLGAEDGILPQVEVVQIENIDEALDKLKAGKTVERQVIKWS